MSCDYENLSFCTLFPLSVAAFVFWNLPFVYKLTRYGENIGDFVLKEHRVSVNSTAGTVNLPIVRLPSYDWTVGFFLHESIPDGINRANVLESLTKTQCRIYRDKLICEYSYPRQVYGHDKVRGYIMSELDDECFVFTVINNDPIDYQKYCNRFEELLED